jgi:hypothetical protein
MSKSVFWFPERPSDAQRHQRFPILDRRLPEGKRDDVRISINRVVQALDYCAERFITL